MSLVRGTGSLTLRGLDIINYCNTNAKALEFNEAYVTTHATPSFANITDPNYIFGLATGATASEGISKEEMDSILSASTVIPSSISDGEKAYGSSSSILPLTVQLATNAIGTETALRLYYMFVKDHEGLRYTLGAGQGANFNVGDTVTDGSNSGKVIYVDGDVISVTHQSGTLAGAITGGTSSPGTGTISSSSDLYILFYFGCLLYDDAGPTISTLSVVPGMNMPIRTQIRFSSGFPDDISFINTSISEIEVHNADPESHDSTHLRLDGGNRPSTNINFGNNRIINLGTATGSGDAIKYTQLRSFTNAAGPVSYAGDINAYFTSDAFSSFLNHSRVDIFDTNITCYTLLGIGEDILISNLHGDSYYNLELAGYDLDMGGIPSPATSNKSIITIQNCSANIKITNLGSGSISTINMSSYNQNTLSFPESECAAIYIQNCSGRIEIVTEDVGGNKGLVIDGNAHSSTVGIYAKNSSNVYVKGVNFTDMGTAITSDQSHIVVDDCESTSTLPANAFVCLNGGKITYLRDNLTDTTQIVSSTNYDFRISTSAGSILEKIQVITLASASGFEIGGYISNSAGTEVGQIVDKKPDDIIYVHIITGTEFAVGNSVDNAKVYAAPATTISAESTKYHEIYEAIAQ